MLIGNYHHNLQGKRRLAIPSQFRDELGEQPILTRGIERCLHILPFNIWSDLLNNLGSNPLVGSDKRNLRRLLAHDAFKLEFDSQGRILLPQDLCDWAQFQKTIVVAGSIDWIELWDRENYKTFMDEIKNDTQSIAERVTHE